MSYILGLDSSTQSLSAMIIDPEAGSIVFKESVSFGGDLPKYNQPSGFIPDQLLGEVHSSPLMWLDALDLLFQKIDRAILSQVTALSGSGQQHGSVYLNDQFENIIGHLSGEKTLSEQIEKTLSRATAPIWMDTSTSQECRQIANAIGGDDVVCAKSGSIAIERFTGPQIRKFALSHPHNWKRTKFVHLVSSFLCSVLSGVSAPIDTGDGAGMNLLNLSDSQWDKELVNATADGVLEKLPAVCESTSKIGKISSYFVEKYGLSSECEIVVWSGDNPCSLVGMGASQVGKAVISLGTSDTLFAAMSQPKTDPNGYGHVFGNPMGGYMSLICFLNGSLAREVVKDDYGLSWDDLGSEGLSQTPVGNGGRLMLPFFGNEITPRLDSDGPIFSEQWSEAELGEPARIVRATLEGQFLNMKVQSEWMGVNIQELLVTGGASANTGICQVIANVFDCPVSRLQTTGSAALGAALKAAVVVDGHEIETLQSRFCKTENQILPDPDAVACYETLMPSFVDLLDLAVNDAG